MTKRWPSELIRRWRESLAVVVGSCPAASVDAAAAADSDRSDGSGSGCDGASVGVV